jgi:hypothetical protein
MGYVNENIANQGAERPLKGIRDNGQVILIKAEMAAVPVAHGPEERQKQQDIQDGFEPLIDFHEPSFAR